MTVEDHTVSFSLEVNVEETYAEIRRLQMVIYRTLSLMRQAGLTGNVEQQIRQIQKLIRLLNALRLAYAAVAAARMAAGDPLAWAQAGVAVGAFAVELAATQEYERRAEQW